MKTETITISVKEYNQLIKNNEFLNCLIDVGVDNWPGFEEAQRLLEDGEE
jgi:hypothetical protein